MAQLQSDANLDGAAEVEGYKVLPPCVIYSKIGQGGMGAVYRGRHLNLDIDVAVKCLKPGLVGDDEQFVVRFRREARSAAAINHQNVIRVYDVAEDHGLHYLIMELVQGETARERVVRKQRLQVGEALEIVHGAALGLAEAHRKGFIHRDIKPDNIMISSAGQVKLADLGLAKAMTRDDHASMLSGANMVMGTPQYMPPEQWEDTTSVTAAADIWALGATLYYLLVGVEAIPKDSLPRIMQRIVHKPFPDVRAERADVPDEVAELIAKATRTAVADRFQNGQELAAAIEDLRSRRVGLRDKDAAPSTQLQTLLSPPPPKTLAKIKFWLDEQSQRPGIDRSPANERSPSTRPNGAAASTRAEAGAPSLNTQSTVPGSQTLPRPRRLVPAFAVLVFAAVAALVLWLRPWLPADDGGPFAVAARLEASGRFEEAIAETVRVYATDPNLAGKETRMARLHASWAGQLATSSRFREALQQLGASLGFKIDPAVQQQQRELLARIAVLVNSGLERTRPSGKQVPREAKTEFRGRLDSPLVAALKLDGSVVAREADGSFRAEVPLDGRREIEVAVTLFGGEQLALPAWTFDYAEASADRASVPLQVDPEVVELDDDKATELMIRVGEGVELRIDGVLVQRAGGAEVYRHRVRSESESPPPIVVVAKKQGSADTTRSVPVRRTAREIEFVAPPEVVGARSLGDNGYAVALATVQLRGQLAERADSVSVNGVPATDLQWREGAFVCTVRLQEGRNDVRLQAQKKFRRPALRQMTVLRLGAPQLALVAPCKADDVTGAASYEIVVSTDEWTTSVTARCGSTTATLAKDREAKGVFRGQIALERGPNQITLEAANIVDAKQTLALRVERSAAAVRPGITSVKVVGAREQAIANKGAGYVRRGGSLRITVSDPAAAISVNNELVRLDNEGTIALASYEPKTKDEAELLIVAKNASGTSDAFRCRLYFDDTAPTIAVQAPNKPVDPGRSFVCSGTWADLRGLGGLTVGDKTAVIKPAGGAARSGTWTVQLDAPVASMDLPLIAEDRAGNRLEQKVRIEIAGTAPTQGLPAGFVAAAGAVANDLGFPRVLVHAATGIELKALGFASGTKPRLYAATSEVTKLQFAGEGTTEPCGDLTADAVAAWLREGRGSGLALPTKAEWETLLAAPADLGFQGLRGGKAEWLQGEPGEASWPLATAAGEPGTLPRDQSRPDLGFRVVLRLP